MLPAATTSVGGIRIRLSVGTVARLKRVGAQHLDETAIGVEGFVQGQLPLGHIGGRRHCAVDDGGQERVHAKWGEVHTRRY